MRFATCNVAKLIHIQLVFGHSLHKSILGSVFGWGEKKLAQPFDY
jgi:hypothetical protein